MTYQETIDWMFSQLPMYQRQGKTAFKKDLTNISAFCDVLKNPQNKFASIHVGGTNGKGSTSISFQVFCKKLVIKLVCIHHLI
jgi:dihydrofolate synthase/folylpolyglutamate synthase